MRFKTAKSVLSIIAASALLASCSGAGGNTAANTAAATDSAATTATAATNDSAAATDNAAVAADAGSNETTYASSDIIKVSMPATDAEKCGNNAKVDWYKAHYGIEFDFIPVNWGDWNEKIATWIATDDSPDLIWWDLKGSQSNQYRTWAQQGAFQPIPIDKLTSRPNINNLFQKMKADGCIDAMTVDGQLYAYPGYRNNPPESNNAYTSFFSYRADWAKKVGLYKESNVYSWDEWEALLKAIIAQDPGGNGPGNTAALPLPPWGFPHAAVLFIGQVPAVGNETCTYYKGDDGKYVWPPTTQGYKEDVHTTWQLYQDGVIWKDSINFKGTEDSDMFQAGTSFVVYNNLTLTEKMLQQGVIKSLDDVQPAMVQDKNGKVWLTQTEDYWTVTAFSPNVDEKKMDRVLDFWDFLNSPDGIMFNWVGVEGKDYTKNADGTVNVLWPKDENGMYISPYPSTSFAFNEFSPASVAPLGNPSQTSYQLDTEKKVWDIMANNPSQMKLFDYKVAFLSAPNKDKYGDFGMDVKTKLTDLIVNSKDIDSDWDAYVKSMLPRVQPVLDEINSALAQ
jgi:ABC-type glycerol-3-phosphate transport system substrate-binding protein